MSHLVNWLFCRAIHASPYLTNKPCLTSENILPTARLAEFPDIQVMDEIQ